ATSRNESPDPFESPAVATGTFNVTPTVTSVPAGIVTELEPRTIECGRPAGLVCEMLKVAGELPLLRTLISFVWLKSALSSENAKFNVEVPVSPRAITFVLTAGIGWTSPVPPRLVRYGIEPPIADGLPVFTIAAFHSCTCFQVG